LFGLPYDIMGKYYFQQTFLTGVDHEYAKKEIERSLAKIGKIASIEIQEYRKFLDIPEEIETVHLPSDF
jgi:hypothetical protein